MTNTMTTSDGLALNCEGHSVYGMPIAKWRECPKLIWWAFKVCWFFGTILGYFLRGKLSEGTIFNAEELLQAPSCWPVGSFDHPVTNNKPFWKRSL